MTVLSRCESKISLHVVERYPSLASAPVDPSYLGFAFEQASFYNYSFDENGNPNSFSQNLINSVLSRTDGKPILRVGGTSGDKGHYNASQSSITNLPATEFGPAFQPPYLSVGPDYFESFKNFPGAEYIFMVPLFHRNLNNTLEWTRQGLSAIGDRLQALEIGNEPDLYSWFSVSKYVNEFVRFKKALSARFPEYLGNRTIYQGLDTSSGGAGNLPVSDALQAGINSTGGISQVGFHLYQDSDVPGAGLEWLQTNVANHSAVVEAMSVFVPNIESLRKHAPGTPFILSEVGNSLGSSDIMQRNILATALWNVDYQLHGMTIGVSRVNNQQIVTPGFQMWEPVASNFGTPLVRANFYSQPMVADFIGKTGTTRVVEVATNDDLLSAYVAYEDEKAARIAIVNLELWTSANDTRPSTGFTLTGLPRSISTAKLNSLTSPEGAYANTTLTWKGLQWTYESKGLEVRIGEDSRQADVKNGTLNLSVNATSTVMIEL